MKRKNILIAILIYSLTGYAQVVKTGKDESSLFAKTTNIGVDVGESELSFNMSNYSRSIKNRAGLIYGFSAKGKNAEGIADLFNNGHIFPEAQLNGMIGLYHSNSKTFANVFDSSEIRLTKKLIKRIEKRRVEVSANSNMTAEEKETFSKLVTDAWATKVNIFENLYKTLKEELDKPGLTRTYKHAVSELKNFMDSDPLYEELKRIQKEIAESSDSITGSFVKYKKHIFYLHGALNRQQFSLFNGWDTVKLSNSFQEINFSGGQGGLGYNYRQGGHLLIGLRYTYKEGNNFSSLTTSKYSYSESKALNAESYVKKEDVVAKAGAYSKVYLNELNVDVAFYTTMQKGSYAIVDLYYKGILSNNDSLYASRSNIGIAASFYKQNSKFIGGIYIELPDADQNAENHKKEPNNRPWQQRLTFGVYTKINLSNLRDISTLF